MRASPGWNERLSGALVALGVQAGIALLLVLSFTVVRLAAPEKETILYLPRPAQKPAVAPMVIDARPRPDARASSVTTGLPPATDNRGIAAPPNKPPSPSEAELKQRLGSALACRPDEHGQPSPLCPAEVKPGDPNAFVPNPPSRVKNEERWAEEKRRSDSNDLGVAVGPGIGVVIQDPLCKLAWVVFGGGFKCGAPPRSTRPATDEQFKAALAAYHRRRGGGPPPALTSKPAEENGNEKDRPAGAGAGAATAPGAGPGRP